MKYSADAVIVAAPISRPVTIGWAFRGVVAPPEMNTLGVTVIVEGSLLVSVTVNPPAGAGVDNVTSAA
jgi:hypothetical protein